MIPYLGALDSLSPAEAGELLAAKTQAHAIDCLNWPDRFPTRPEARFAIARSSTAFVVHFMVNERDVLARHTEPLSPVAADSCVEWFVRVPDSTEYYNFEFNAIGAVNASRRVTRNEPTRLTLGQIKQIQVAPSLGTQPFGLREGQIQWSLTAVIPFSLLELSPRNLPPHLFGNFYCCAGGKTPPHYLTWRPILSDKPDFHRPEFFDIITLDPQP